MVSRTLAVLTAASSSPALQPAAERGRVAG
jgi:hypothetical protein